LVGPRRLWQRVQRSPVRRSRRSFRPVRRVLPPRTGAPPGRAQRGQAATKRNEGASHAETRRSRRGGAEVGLIKVNSAPSAAPREVFPLRVLPIPRSSVAYLHKSRAAAPQRGQTRRSIPLTGRHACGVRTEFFNRSPRSRRACPLVRTPSYTSHHPRSYQRSGVKRPTQWGATVGCFKPSGGRGSVRAGHNLGKIKRLGRSLALPTALHSLPARREPCAHLNTPRVSYLTARP
jgi:hypothetical protein